MNEWKKCMYMLLFMAVVLGYCHWKHAYAAKFQPLERETSTVQRISEAIDAVASNPVVNTAGLLATRSEDEKAQWVSAFWHVAISAKVTSWLSEKLHVEATLEHIKCGFNNMVCHHDADELSQRRKHKRDQEISATELYNACRSTSTHFKERQLVLQLIFDLFSVTKWQGFVCVCGTCCLFVLGCIDVAEGSISQICNLFKHALCFVRISVFNPLCRNKWVYNKWTASLGKLVSLDSIFVHLMAMVLTSLAFVFEVSSVTVICCLVAGYAVIAYLAVDHHVDYTWVDYEKPAGLEPLTLLPQLRLVVVLATVVALSVYVYTVVVWIRSNLAITHDAFRDFAKVKCLVALLNEQVLDSVSTPWQALQWVVFHAHQHLGH